MYASNEDEDWIYLHETLRADPVRDFIFKLNIWAKFFFCLSTDSSKTCKFNG